MHKEVTTIHFSTNLIYLPIEIGSYKEAIREIYHELAKEDNCDYDNISLQGFPNFPPQFNTKRGKTVSLCEFKKDRIVIREEWAEITLDEFSHKILQILTRAFRLLDIKFLVMQVCTIRCLFTSSPSVDARGFLAEKVCSLKAKEHIIPYFQRQAQLFGIRLSFPPNKDKINSFDAKIESFNQDFSKIFVEINGTFPLVKPITATNIEVAKTNMKETYDFCERNIGDFLDQFDKKGET